MLGRIATYALPLVAVAAVGAVLLGPGAAGSAVAVRVYGAPIAGQRALALRLEGVERRARLDTSIALEGLRVEARSGGGAPGEWAGSTGEDGVAEIGIDARDPLQNAVDLRVLRGAEVLAEGRVSLSPAPSPVGPALAIEGARSGALRVHVEVTRGQLAAPFPDALRVRVTDPEGAPVVDVRVTASASAAASLPADAAVTDAAGSATLVVTPLFHEVELTLEARAAGDRAGRWEGTLPIVPGALWMAPARPGDAAITIRAPTPRERAYVSFANATGRVGGAVVPLAMDAAGFASGTTPLPASASFVVVSADPYEQGSGTVGWPMTEGTVTTAPLALLLDGVPAAEAREATRAWTFRGTALAIVALAALAEAWLMVRLGRRSSAELERHFAQASREGSAAPLSDDDRARVVATSTRRPARLVAIVALVLLGFGVIAATVLMR